MYEECGSNRCVHRTKRSLRAAACCRRAITRGTMRGDATSLFDSAIVPAPSSDHSANPRLMPRSAVKEKGEKMPIGLSPPAAHDSKKGRVVGRGVGVITPRLSPAVSGG